MPTSTLLLEPTATLGPLSVDQRAAIMRHAVALEPEARRVFRRLLILAQPHGLAEDLITRSAAQAKAHFAA
jgi:hypothetical protein